MVVLDVDKDEKVRYKLVTSEDVDVAKGLISTGSPIGRGLLGKQVGDSVRITIPGGVREMEIIELTTIHQAAEGQMTITHAIGYGSNKVIRLIVRGLALSRIHPNVLTFLGLVINMIAAYLLAVGQFRWGGR